MHTDVQKRSLRFADLGLSADFVRVLTKLKFTQPTPIQEKAIPLALQGKDVIGTAQTGSGKTLSFFLPMLQNISGGRGIGLIVVPTRELAQQVSDEIDRVGRPLGFKTTVLVGGADMHRQVRALRNRPDVIIATPGRLNDHLEQKTARLDRVKVLVLDEADRMLDMGFAPQINQILKSVPDKRQTLLFSATMADGVTRIAHGYMKDPVRVAADPVGESAENIDQAAVYIDKSNKFQLLKDLLDEYKHEPVLVFCRTKHGTSKMAKVLNREGYRAEELHANRSLNQRRRALENFKQGRSRIVIATDVAARGIDVKEIALVVNYDLPDKEEDYVHRIGRTGRAGHIGRALSFVEPDQFKEMRLIERLVGKEVPVLEAPGTYSLEDVQKLASRYVRPTSGGRGRPRHSRSGARRPMHRRRSRSR